MCFGGPSAESRYQKIKKTYDPLPSLKMDTNSMVSGGASSQLRDVRRKGIKKRSLLTPLMMDEQ